MKTSNIIKMVLLCIFLNYIGQAIASGLSLPIWFDTFGTVLCASVLGPVCGMIVGLTHNLLMAFQDPMNLLYAPASLVIAFLVGYYAKRRVFDDLFKTITLSTAITFAAVMISSPMNLLFHGGTISNVWGDGVCKMLFEVGIPWWLSSIIGQTYVEFVDKGLTLLTLYLLYRHRQWKLKKEAVASAMAILMFVGMIAPVKANEIDNTGEDYRTYIQTIYNNENGVPSGECNAIASTSDGLLWFGTYAGLYRYNGTEFQYMNQFKSIKNVNCLYVDLEGRLFIGTNDDGLSICINEEISNVVSVEDGLPSSSIRSIVQHGNGSYYLGTSDALVVLELNSGLHITKTFDDIIYTTALASDNSQHVVALDDQGHLYIIHEDELVAQPTFDYVPSGISFIDDELYIGDSDGAVHIYDIKEDQLFEQRSFYCPSTGNINAIERIESGEIMICGDGGISYVDVNGNINFINTGDFNNGTEHMCMDYQGNLWFTSTRLGILKLSPSVFTDIYQKNDINPEVVNAITKWNDQYYFGSDAGLTILDDNHNSIHNALTNLFNGIRIRCVFVDSKNQLWLSTNGQGLYLVNDKGEIKNYNLEDGIAGNKLRQIIERDDGTIIVSGNSGVTLIKDGQVVETISDVLENTKILSVCLKDNNVLLLGSDGGGLYAYYDGKIINTYNRHNGLNSEVILKIIKEVNGNGYFIITSNGICYLDDHNNLRSLDNVPYSNNYDLFEDEDGVLFITSSAGIYVIDKNELLSGKDVGYALLDNKMGLRSILTANSFNLYSEEGYSYLCSGSGVYEVDLNNYTESIRSYRMMIKQVYVDGVNHIVDKGSEFIVGRDTNHIEIIPEVINYSSNDPYVSYYLEGFDKEPNIVLQSELNGVTYTNLSTGQYIFHLAVLSNDQQTVIEEIEFEILKAREIFDYWWFKVYFTTVGILFVAWLSWFITRTQIQRTLTIQKKELELAKAQIEMGNETIVAIAKTVDAKDSNTSMHSTRVSQYSVLIAKRLGFNEEQIENLRKTALLHDIGKIGVPDSILNKPARLTNEEYEIMKSHVVRGAEILREFTLVDGVIEGALYHHERYDGKGYVHGLSGEDIPLNARIIGLADAFDAMSANRVYRQRLDFDYVVNEIKNNRGKQFDPQIVDIFLELIEEKIIDPNAIYGKEEE